MRAEDICPFLMFKEKKSIRKAPELRSEAFCRSKTIIFLAILPVNKPKRYQDFLLSTLNNYTPPKATNHNPDAALLLYIRKP